MATHSRAHQERTAKLAEATRSLGAGWGLLRLYEDGTRHGNYVSVTTPHGTFQIGGFHLDRIKFFIESPAELAQEVKVARLSAARSGQGVEELQLELREIEHKYGTAQVDLLRVRVGQGGHMPQAEIEARIAALEVQAIGVAGKLAAARVAALAEVGFASEDEAYQAFSPVA